MDTIFAVSSGLLPSGVAVIRLSGPHVVDIVKTLCGRLPKARFMHYGNLTARDGSFLDSGLTVFFLLLIVLRGKIVQNSIYMEEKQSLIVFSMNCRHFLDAVLQKQVNFHVVLLWKEN